MCLWELGELTFDNSGREGFSRAAWHHLAQLVGPQGAQDIPHQLRKHEGKSVEQRENKIDAVKINRAKLNVCISNLSTVIFLSI